MAVAASDLVPSLKSRVSPPGTDLYPTSVDAEWEVQITNAFWDVRLHGLLTGFTENAAIRGGPADFVAGIITPIGAVAGYDDPDGWNEDEDLPREQQQLLVLWAAWRVTLAQMQSIKTQFRAKAGPVEYEKQQSATVLKGVLDALKAELDFLKTRLMRYGNTSAVLDAVIERDYSQSVGDGWWVR